MFTLALFCTMWIACKDKTPEYSGFNDYPTPVDVNLWLEYTPEVSLFKIWSPTASMVRLHLYASGEGGDPLSTHDMEAKEMGLWQLQLKGDLQGTYYTFQVQIEGNWLEETPGIYAQAVGVNGERAMVIDMNRTNPRGWQSDKGPNVMTPNEAIIYEMHVRDLSIHPQSGIQHKGTFLGLTEPRTISEEGLSTGLDHIKEMGVTHVHLLPSFDHYSINERKLDSAQYNWGYDPKNYNVPEGSYATDPYHAEVRVKEFKEMVKAFHDQGVGVILDVVYNHTGITENSNFNLEVPGYYYRFREDGSYSDAAACGNETASERAMMRKFMIESVLYWAKEYHLDGFRFDLMGIHDVTTMNEIASALRAYNPNILIYGEGWTAGDSPLPVEDRGIKINIPKMPLVSAFSDDLRDGLKGSVFEDMSKGFVSGASNTEASIQFGVVGCIDHPDIDTSKVNYSKAPWTLEPWQSIAYVSCHDNHTLYDKLKISRPDASEEELIAMDKLAMAIVMTSQGIAFVHAGSELLRTKEGNHNSYNLPDSINQIDWSRKDRYAQVVTYYKNLISLRKQHPAFHMPSAEAVRSHLQFRRMEDGLLSYQISGYANGDKWKEILVIYNARNQSVSYPLEGTWYSAVKGDTFYEGPMEKEPESVTVPAQTMAILFQL
jgi:pullulanase